MGNNLWPLLCPYSRAESIFVNFPKRWGGDHQTPLECTMVAGIHSSEGGLSCPTGSAWGLAMHLRPAGHCLGASDGGWNGGTRPFLLAHPDLGICAGLVTSAWGNPTHQILPAGDQDESTPPSSALWELISPLPPRNEGRAPQLRLQVTRQSAAVRRSGPGGGPAALGSG